MNGWQPIETLPDDANVWLYYPLCIVQTDIQDGVQTDTVKDGKPKYWHPMLTNEPPPPPPVEPPS